jgi:hypothetical protein
MAAFELGNDVDRHAVAGEIGVEDNGSLIVATFCPECAEREFRGEPVADTGG